MSAEDERPSAEYVTALADSTGLSEQAVRTVLEAAIRHGLEPLSPPEGEQP